jgi:hypothetical protein
VGLRARDFPTERVLSRTPLIIRTVDHDDENFFKEKQVPPTKLAASQAYVAFKQRLLLNLTNSCSAVVFVVEEDVLLWRDDSGRHDSLNVVLV